MGYVFRFMYLAAKAFEEEARGLGWEYLAEDLKRAMRRYRATKNLEELTVMLWEEEVQALVRDFDGVFGKMYYTLNRGVPLRYER